MASRPPPACHWVHEVQWYEVQCTWGSHPSSLQSAGGSFRIPLFVWGLRCLGTQTQTPGQTETRCPQSAQWPAKQLPQPAPSLSLRWDLTQAPAELGSVPSHSATQLSQEKTECPHLRWEENGGRGQRLTARLSSRDFWGKSLWGPSTQGPRLPQATRGGRISFPHLETRPLAPFSGSPSFCPRQ